MSTTADTAAKAVGTSEPAHENAQPATNLASTSAPGVESSPNGPATSTTIDSDAASATLNAADAIHTQQDQSPAAPSPTSASLTQPAAESSPITDTPRGPDAAPAAQTKASPPIKPAQASPAPATVAGSPVVTSPTKQEHHASQQEPTRPSGPSGAVTAQANLPDSSAVEASSSSQAALLETATTPAIVETNPPSTEHMDAVNDKQVPEPKVDQTTSPNDASDAKASRTAPQLPTEASPSDLRSSSGQQTSPATATTTSPSSVPAKSTTPLSPSAADGAPDKETATNIVPTAPSAATSVATIVPAASEASLVKHPATQLMAGPDIAGTDSNTPTGDNTLTTSPAEQSLRESVQASMAQSLAPTTSSAQLATNHTTLGLPDLSNNTATSITEPNAQAQIQSQMPASIPTQPQVQAQNQAQIQPHFDLLGPNGAAIAAVAAANGISTQQLYTNPILFNTISALALSNMYQQFSMPGHNPTPGGNAPSSLSGMGMMPTNMGGFFNPPISSANHTPTGTEEEDNSKPRRPRRLPKHPDQRDKKKQLFHNLKVGMKVIVSRTPKLGSTDILVKHPELEGKAGHIKAVPQYPATWLSVAMEDSGRVFKMRTSNIRLADGSGPEVIQTERLNRSLFFNKLQTGVRVWVLDGPKSKLKADAPPKSHGRAGTIVRAPVYPSTWLTVKLDKEDKTIKVRTSQVAFMDDADAPSDAEVLNALHAQKERSQGRAKQSRDHDSDGEASPKRSKRRSSTSAQKRKSQDAQARGMMAMPNLPGVGAVPLPSLNAFGGMAVDESLAERYPTADASAQARPGWRPSISKVINDDQHAALPEGGTGPSELRVGSTEMRRSLIRSARDDLEAVRMIYCRETVMRVLLDHRLSWPFILPVSEAHLAESKTARQLVEAYQANELPNFNTIRQLLETGAYQVHSEFTRDLRRLFGHCYARFADDTTFVELVIELEIVLDEYLSRMPNSVTEPQRRALQNLKEGRSELDHGGNEMDSTNSSVTRLAAVPSARGPPSAMMALQRSTDDLPTNLADPSLQQVVNMSGAGAEMVGGLFSTEHEQLPPVLISSDGHS